MGPQQSLWLAPSCCKTDSHSLPHGSCLLPPRPGPTPVAAGPKDIVALSGMAAGKWKEWGEHWGDPPQGRGGHWPEAQSRREGPGSPSASTQHRKHSGPCLLCFLRPVAWVGVARHCFPLGGGSSEAPLAPRGLIPRKKRWPWLGATLLTAASRSPVL